MDPKVVFWTGAFVNMALILGLVFTGVRSIRRGDVARHRFCMKTSAWLVAGFLAAYVGKLALLGREQFSSWSPAAVNTLRFHELCVLAMIGGGCLALVRARSMRSTRNVTRQPHDAPAAAHIVRWHRRGGWTAVVGAVLGLASAGLVLLGMYRRADLL